MKKRIFLFLSSMASTLTFAGVNLTSGALLAQYNFLEKEDGSPKLIAIYDSASPHVGLMGKGWSFGDIDTRITSVNGGAELREGGGGALVMYRRLNGHPFLTGSGCKDDRLEERAGGFIRSGCGVHQEFDSSGRILEDNGSYIKRDNKGKPLVVRNNKGSLLFKYYSTGDLQEITLKSTGPLISTRFKKNEPDTLVVSDVRADSEVNSYRFKTNSDGKIIEIGYIDKTKRLFDYDQKGRLLMEIDRDGTPKRKHVYDDNQDGSSSHKGIVFSEGQPLRMSQIDFDSKGRVLQVTEGQPGGRGMITYKADFHETLPFATRFYKIGERDMIVKYKEDGTPSLVARNGEYQIEIHNGETSVIEGYWAVSGKKISKYSVSILTKDNGREVSVKDVGSFRIPVNSVFEMDENAPEPISGNFTEALSVYKACDTSINDALSFMRKPGRFQYLMD